MVNTFLTHSNYRKSAQNLDNARLGKQRVEAYQILLLLEDLNILSKLFKYPIPKNPYSRRSWIRKVTKKYKDLKKYLFRHQGSYVWIDKESKPYRLGNNETAIINNDNTITVTRNTKGKKSKKIYKKYQVILEDDRLITLGFVYHPVVCMWLCHENSLKEYIDAHIDEWICRGHKNTMKRYGVKSQYPPIWTLDERIHKNHKAALYIKEVKRNESPWYQNKLDFKQAWEYYSKQKPTNPNSTSDFDNYIWPFNKKDDLYEITQKDGKYFAIIRI